MIHALKEHPEHFNNVISGKKTFEVRKNDRDFHENDLVALNEYDSEKKEYTGRSCLVYIDYILDDEQYCLPGHIVMSVKPCRVGKVRHFDPLRDADYNSCYKVPLATEANNEDGDDL